MTRPRETAWSPRIPDLGNGDQGRGRTIASHRSDCVRLVQRVNTASGTAATGSKGAAMYYDGRKWHYVKTMKDINNVPVSLWKTPGRRHEPVRIRVKTNTVVMELDNLGGFPVNTNTYEVPRSYPGPFNRVSMNMGNVLSTSQKVTTWTRSKSSRGLSSVPFPWGPVAYAPAWASGRAALATQNDCANGLGGTYLGDDTQCGVNNGNCRFCPLYFGDMDQDDDVDQGDFGGFQLCLTGPGPLVLTAPCNCSDSDGDSDVDADDLSVFQACLQGAGTPRATRPVNDHEASRNTSMTLPRSSPGQDKDSPRCDRR